MPELELQQSDEEWQYKFIENFQAGLELTSNPDLIDENGLSEAKLVRYLDKGIVTDYGTAIYNVAVRGTPRLEIEFIGARGFVENLLVTNSTFYKDYLDQWQYVSNGISATLTSLLSAGGTILPVVDSTGFAVGDFIGVALDNGIQHQTTVSSLTATTITMADAIPAGRNAPSGAIVVKAILFSGVSDKQPTFVQIPSHDWVVITNGVDVVHRYDGNDIVPVPNLPAGGNTVCQTVGLLANHLLLIGVEEGGGSGHYRVRWSATGDPTNWTATDAGFEELFDKADKIIAYANLGPYGIIYRQNSIAQIEHLGILQRLFFFRNRISGKGVYSARSVAVINSNLHLFVGDDNVYIFDGTSTPIPIANKLAESIFKSATSYSIAPSSRHHTICFYHAKLNEAIVAYRSTAATGIYCDKVLRYSVDKNAWSERPTSFPSISGIGALRIGVTTPWIALVGAWSAQTFKWGPIASLLPTLVFSTNSGGDRVLQYDSSLSLDDGAPISWSIKTKEFYHPQLNMRLDHIDLEAYADVSGSLTLTMDIGVLGSDVVFSPIALTTTRTRYRLSAQRISRTVNFKISGTGSGIRMNWLGFKYRLESEI